MFRDFIFWVCLIFVSVNITAVKCLGVNNSIQRCETAMPSFIPNCRLLFYLWSCAVDLLYSRKSPLLNSAQFIEDLQSIFPKIDSHMHHLLSFFGCKTFYFIYIENVQNSKDITSAIIFETYSWLPATDDNFKKLYALISSHDNRVYKLI